MKLFIKDFPDDLHQQLKIKAAHDKISLYQLVINLLRKALESNK
jgi:plasmid stability protein